MIGEMQNSDRNFFENWQNFSQKWHNFSQKWQNFSKSGRTLPNSGRTFKWLNFSQKWHNFSQKWWNFSQKWSNFPKTHFVVTGLKPMLQPGNSEEYFWHRINILLQARLKFTSSYHLGKFYFTKSMKSTFCFYLLGVWQGRVLTMNFKGTVAKGQGKLKFTPETYDR